ncbi:hypothetical protein, partial [Tenacibaculum sediminilitoris]|uniref:hypothetical protein n=1 Tax=Tenacibaculum sediminilitoris TaxID=1820334 RepID=UPI0038B5409B
SPATGATITPTASNGNGGPYTFELFDSTSTSVSTTSPFTDVAAGTYTVVATDRLGCTSAPVTVIVNPVTAVTFTAEPLCYDGTNGQIVVTANTGNGDYIFSLNGTTWQQPTPLTSNTYTFSGLSDGNYTVYVQDGKGCTVNTPVTINPQLLATADVTNASCNDGEILINPSGGTGAGTYVFSVVTDGLSAGAFSTTNPVTTAVGVYDVYVRDNNGAAGYCEYIIQDVVIDAVTPIDITATVNEPTCNGDAGSVDGQIVANTGQAPHTIVIRNSANVVVDTINNFLGANFSFNNLVVDSYTITITDDLGCSDTFSFSLTNPPAIPMNIEPILPTDCTIISPANTGLDFNFKSLTLASFAPYTLEYTIDGSTWIDMSTLVHSISVAPHPTPGDNLYSVRGLTPGQVYYPAIRIMDGTTIRCQVDNGIFVMPFQVSGIVVNVVPSGNCTTGYSATVEAVNGVGPFEFGISTDDPINTGIWYPADDPIGNPRVKVFTNIIPGLNYQFFVRDTNTLCIEMNDDPIDYSLIDSTFDVNITSAVSNQSCNGSNNGQIEFTIEDTDGVLTGNTIGWELYDGITDSPLGITGTITDTETYPHTFNVPPTATLNPGLYFIVIESTSGGTCQWASGDIEILEGESITGNLNVLNNITCSVDGAVRIENISGGFPGYTYNVTSVTNTTLTTPITLTGNTFNIAYGDVSDVTLPVNVTVEVVDTNGCTETFGPVALSVSISPTINLDNVVSCDSNKTITVSASSGLAPYQYSINGGTFTSPTSNPYTFSALAAGSYDVVVRDANGCTDSLIGIVVHPDIDFNLQVTQNAICTVDGEVTLNITSGAGGDYTYSVDGSPGINIGATTTATITLAPGTYNITVSDATSGCSDTKAITVQDPVQPSFTHVAENSLCSGDNSGVITLTAVDNGILPISYTISPVAGTYDGASTFSDLPPGTYDITGTAVNGCDTTITGIVITEYAPVVSSTPIVTEFGCTTGNTVNVASVELPVGIVGGSGTYSRVVFTYTPNSGSVEILDSSNFIFTTTNTSGGTVDITVYDDQGCSGTTSATIQPFNELSAPLVTLDTAITCSTGEDITVTYTSTAPVVANISIEGINGNTYGLVTNTTGDFDNLPTGDYQITIENPTTGCELVTYYTVGDEPVFDLLITGIEDVDCQGDSNGSAVLNFSSSTPYTSGYTYTVYTSSGVATAITGAGTGGTPTTITGLSAGTYYVRIDMGANSPFCEAQSSNFTIAEPLAPLSVVGNTNPVVSCNNGSDATITATATGGWGTYVYQLEETSNPGVAYAGNSYSSNNIFTNLPAGDYTVVVRDKDGVAGRYCEASNQVVIANPTPVTFTVSETDNVCDTSVGGSIEVNALGGTGTYTYTLSNSGGIFETQTLTATTYTFTNLPADTYTVNVVDSNGCDAGTPTNVTINPDVNFSLVETKKVDCSVSPDGIVTVDFVNWTSGTSNYTYDVSGSVEGSLVTNVVVTSDPFTITIPNGNTTPQTYTVTVRDLDATPMCDVSRTIEIQPEIRPDFTPVVTASLCSGDNSGVITLTAVDNGILPISYTISPVAGTYDGASTFSDLPPGTYDITGTAVNGCDTTITGIVITEYAPVVSSTPIVTEFGCTTGNTVNVASVELPVGIVGGSGTYSRVVFTYTPNSGSVEILDSSNFIFTTTNTSGGTVDITVYDDQGCSGTTSATIQPFNELSAPLVTLDTAITCSTGEDITVTYTSTAPVVANISIEGINGNTYGLVTNTTGDFDNLPTGDYQITIENPTTGCELVTYYTVGDEPVFDLLITGIEDVDCQGDSNGSAVLNFSSSTPYTSGYTYTVYTSSGVATAITGAGTGGTPTTITGLSAGTYYVRIDMGANSPFCEAQSSNFTIAEPLAPLSVVGNTNPVVSCNNGSDATITATATGGWGTYVYQLEETSNPGVAYAGNSYSSNNIFTNLPAGDYTVVVRDKDGVAGRYCEASNQVVIANPTPVTFTVSETDNVCDTSVGGSIEVNALGGTGTYTYTLSNSGGIFETQTLTATTYTFTNLPADTYTVNVVDSNGCDAGTPTNVTINPDVNFSLVETKKVDCSVSPDGIVTVDFVNWTSGTSNYTYDVSGSVEGSLVTNVVVTSDPFTITIPNGNTTPQTYTVTVRDLDATPMCDVSRTIEIQPEIRPDFT